MNRVLIAAIAATTLCAGPAMAQSAKFAATYDTDIRMVDVSAGGADPGCVDMEGVTVCQSFAGPIAEAELASLHVANWKELLIGMSGQVNLITFTQAKGKNNGGTATAVAEGMVRAGVLVLPEGLRQGNAPGATCARAFGAYDRDGTNLFAPPGPVVFASRHQQLSVTTALDIVDADDCAEIDGDGTLEEGECLADLLEIEGSVTVALGLDTKAAHHFNFVKDDLNSGTYDVIGCYDLSALAEASGLDIDEDTQARAKAAIGPRILTVQEVRATKSGVIDESCPYDEGDCLR